MWTINAPCTFIILLRHTSNLLSGVWTIHLKCAIPKGKGEILLLVTLGLFLKKRQTLFSNTLPSKRENALYVNFFEKLLLSGFFSLFTVFFSLGFSLIHKVSPYP